MNKKMTLFIVFAMLAGCSLRERANETPVPNPQNSKKDFFVGKARNNKKKRFLLGWAPIEKSGQISEMAITHLVQEALHVNIEFEITEKALIGKAVNPSFPNRPDKWVPVIKIPIKKHYYYEASKDEYGRDTNVIKENTSRSHWSKRPHMKLDFNGIEIYGSNSAGTRSSTGFVNRSIDEDVEWDEKTNFLAFNVNSHHSLHGSEFSVKYRYNMMEFEPDKSFKATPFHLKNVKHFNILHVVSRKVEMGNTIDKQVMHAAKWDFSKPLDVYLNGVPDKYVGLFKETFNEWSLVLEKIGAVPVGQKAFNVRTDYPSKYPFDLRYPAVHWVGDKRISMNSPLGVALNNADVSNGKMLSANVIMYGGMLDNLLNRYSESTNEVAKVQAVSKEFFPSYSFKSFDFSTDIFRKSSQISSMISRKSQEHLRARLSELQKKTGRTGAEKALIESINTDLNRMKSSDVMLKLMNSFTHSSNEFLGGQSIIESEKDVQNFIAQAPMAKLSGYSDLLINNEKNETPLHKAMEDSARFKQGAVGVGPIIYHGDRTFANSAPAWLKGIDASADKEEAKRSLIKNILLHELGHFLGLGHQFKGSIVPEYGTVPKKYTNHPSNLKNKESLFFKSQPKNGMQNYTSIMDYMNGRIEVAIPEKDVKPGAHDELVLRYIYNSEITVYNKEKDRFEYINLKEINEDLRGYIPETALGHKVSYFPACNDYDASFLKDPMCNRWDVGSTPLDIVKSYTADINNNVNSILFNFTDSKQTSVAQAENRLWHLSLYTFSHLRTFYDKMRIKLNKTPINPDSNTKISMWDQLKTDEEALFGFSDACKVKDAEVDEIHNETLKVIMKDKEIKGLCLASIEVLETVKKYVGLPAVDYTRLGPDRDTSGGYIVGEGMTNWGRYIYGDWQALSNLPLKIVAMHTVTTSNPYIMLGPYLMNNFFYDYQGYRFMYRTLFPREITEMTSIAVGRNMNFASRELENKGGANKTTMGKAVLSLSYFNSLMNYGPYAGNEASDLPANYVATIQDQTNFEFSLAAILIKKVDDPKSKDPNRIKKFTAEIFDFQSFKAHKVKDFYILPKSRVIVIGKNSFVYSLSKLRFYTDTDAYALAYKINYDSQPNVDPLYESSVKARLTDEHNEILKSCIEGAGESGLKYYFKQGGSSDFKGFEVHKGIATEVGDTRKKRFEVSIAEEFVKYEKFAKRQNKNLVGLGPRPMEYRCNEALKGIGLISSVAGLLNGYWLGVAGNYVGN